MEICKAPIVTRYVGPDGARWYQINSGPADPSRYVQLSDQDARRVALAILQDLSARRSVDG